MNKNRDVIAVDGLAAAGKSVCRALANRIGYRLLETGPIYRTLALLVQRFELRPDDTYSIGMFVKENVGRLAFWEDTLTLDGETVGAEIRAPEVTALTPCIAMIPEVRRLVLPLQRQFGEHTKGIVAEGRDMTSVVFPDARVKIFLTAPLSIRAERRWKQFRTLDPRSDMTLDQVAADLQGRDRVDSHRLEAPLVTTADSITVDTGTMTMEQVLDRLEQLCQASTASF